MEEKWMKKGKSTSDLFWSTWKNKKKQHTQPANQTKWLGLLLFWWKTTGDWLHKSQIWDIIRIFGWMCMIKNPTSDNETRLMIMLNRFSFFLLLISCLRSCGVLFEYSRLTVLSFYNPRNYTRLKSSRVHQIRNEEKNRTKQNRN